MTNLFEIKAELQGNSGLINAIRKIHLPSTNLMAIRAQALFEEEGLCANNIDEALNRLLNIEYIIYLEKQNEIVNRFIEYADSEASILKYPQTRKILDNFKLDIKMGKLPTTTLEGITSMIIALADSNRQSRVSRSGSSLMHHISYLLKKSNFIFQKDYQREYILDSGCKLDFFFPNKEMYYEEPKNCCAVACQTTSNDRFRLTFAQMPNNTRNRACTAIGSSNFGDKLGPKSLTDTKLHEAKANEVKFVILNHAIDDRLRNSKAVMSYQEWFNELLSLKAFW